MSFFSFLHVLFLTYIFITEVWLCPSLRDTTTTTTTTTTDNHNSNSNSNNSNNSATINDDTNANTNQGLALPEPPRAHAYAHLDDPGEHERRLGAIILIIMMIITILWTIPESMRGA